jgi:aryl-alcohol dehydrogenase-like predicted oxidoreductase
MRYAEFGKTGMKVSAITAGTWGIGGEGWGGADREKSIEALRAMLDAGVTMIDTAPFYGVGLAERIVGEAIKGRDRSKLYVVTKVGVTFPEGKQYEWKKNLSRQSIIAELEASLKNLHTDYIDLYIAHWPDVDTKAPASETFGTLAELKSRGKIRHIGVSNFSQEQIQEAMRYADIEAFQPQHSMLFRGSEALMTWTHSKGIANMAYAPLGAGILSGAYRTLPRFDENDWRSLFYPYFKEPMFGKVQELLKTLDAIAASRGVSVAQVSINWSTQHKLVDTALIGVRSAKNAKDSCAAMDWALSKIEIGMIDQAIADTVEKA